MRGYGEELEVKADAGGRPFAFRWRGRHYRVQEHLETWQARTAWWQQEGDAADLRLEEAVWRVDAVCGARRGVFELRGGARSWVLVGIAD